MQEVEATCSRLVILSQGRLAAQGSVQELLAARTGGARYVVEAEGQGVAEGLRSLSGVTSHAEEQVDGRVRVQLEAGDEGELRPDIFRMARDRGWTLWELHRERASLEQVFRRLTAEEPAEEPAEAVADEGRPDDGSAGTGSSSTVGEADL
jgi:ABC-2 type transport system ATP-binding protein